MLRHVAEAILLSLNIAPSTLRTRSAESRSSATLPQAWSRAAEIGAARTVTHSEVSSLDPTNVGLLGSS